MRDQLEGLVGQMVERGILFDEAVGEFEKRFIKRVLDNAQRQPVPRRETPWAFTATRSAARSPNTSWTIAAAKHANIPGRSVYVDRLEPVHAASESKTQKPIRSGKTIPKQRFHPKIKKAPNLSSGAFWNQLLKLIGLLAWLLRRGRMGHWLLWRTSPSANLPRSPWPYPNAA